MDHASGATSIFRAGGGPQRQQYAAPPVTGSRKVPQWVFLSQFFNNVLLADRAAMGASGSSSKTSFARRLLLDIAASVLCFILITGFTISFFRNRGLEAQVREAAQGIPSSESAGGDLASVDSLRKLDTLRQAIQRLVEYRRGWRAVELPLAPLRRQRPLSRGAARLLRNRFKQLLFGQTRSGILVFLQNLPVTPGPDYAPTYDALKAYVNSPLFVPR